MTSSARIPYKDSVFFLIFVIMYVDCHCHILPSLDDGAGSMEESVRLARKQVSWGYQRAICTSHRNRLYRTTPAMVIDACDLLREELERRGIPLELVPSMEYRLVPETWPETLEKGWLLPWEGNHILVELPISDGTKVGNIVPEEEIRKLVAAGYQPVLAHPERYLYLTPDRYESLKEAGALFQRNAGSIEGLYGPAVSARARDLAARGRYDLLGTDLHNGRYAAFFDSFGFRA